MIRSLKSHGILSRRFGGNPDIESLIGDLSFIIGGAWVEIPENSEMEVLQQCFYLKGFRYNIGQILFVQKISPYSAKIMQHSFLYMAYLFLELALKASSYPCTKGLL